MIGMLREMGKDDGRSAILVGLGAALSVAAISAHAQKPAANDPRVGLSLESMMPAWRRATSSWASTAARRRFFDPKALGDLNYAYSDFAFRDDVLFQGSFHGFNFYNIEDPRAPKLVPRFSVRVERAISR